VQPPVRQKSAPFAASLDLALVAGCGAYLLSWLPSVAWPLEVLGNFVVQAALGGGVVAAFFALRRRWWRAGLAVVFAVLWAIPWLLRPQESPPPSAGPTVVVSLHNVLRTNTTPHRVAEELDAWAPDLAVLEEVSEAWTPTLTRLSADWPHQVFQPADHNFGIAAISRVPLASAEVRHFVGPPAETLPALDLTVPTHLGPFRVVAVHFVPPVGRTAARVRDAQIDALVDLFRDRTAERTILVGDLNTTLFAATYRRLLDGTGLVDVRQGRGLLPTWPAGMPELLRLSLDHMLLSPDLVARDVQVGGLTGSDHRGIRVEVAARR